MSSLNTFFLSFAFILNFRCNEIHDCLKRNDCYQISVMHGTTFSVRKCNRQCGKSIPCRLLLAQQKQQKQTATNITIEHERNKTEKYKKKKNENTLKKIMTFQLYHIQLVNKLVILKLLKWKKRETNRTKMYE